MTTDVVNHQALKDLIREMLQDALRQRDEATPPTPADKRMLTVDDVCDITGWHRNHIYRLVKQGRLQKVPNLGREVKFAPEVVEGLRENGLR